jgi:hypothetical protein
MLKYTIEVIGSLAAALMLSAYLLLTSGRLSSRSNLCHWMNVLSGAGLVFAYPSAFISVVWIAIALCGVLGRHLAAPSSTTS